MRNGQKIWICSRISELNAEYEEFAEPQEFVLRNPSPLSPISITCQPKNGFTDRLSQGETTVSDQRIILTPYQYWQNRFRIGDRAYIDGVEPSDDEEWFGQNANYYVEFVAFQNYAIELSLKQIQND